MRKIKKRIPKLNITKTQATEVVKKIQGIKSHVSHTISHTNPARFWAIYGIGIEVTNVGCYGFGIFEVTPFCNPLSPVCKDASKYVFFDAFHSSEISIRYTALEPLTESLPKFLR